MELTLLRIRIKDVHNAYNHYRRFCGIISSPFIFAFAFCYCGDEIPLAEMSAAFCSFDCQVDGLRDALALPVTWPRGRKVLSVGNPTSLKPRYWRGERTRLGTHQIRPEGVASRRTVGWPNPTGETPGTHQRDRRRLSFDARRILVSVKSRV